MKKPRPVNEWDLDEETKAKVKYELKKWLKLFINQANGKAGNIFRADFIKDDFFYFTNCNDILLDNPEAKGIESNLKIRSRKRKVMLQLLIRTLLGEKLGKILTCSHCGFVGERIEGSASLGGHFKFCPNCKKTTIVTFPNYYNVLLDEVKDYVKGDF